MSLAVEAMQRAAEGGAEAATGGEWPAEVAVGGALI